MYICAHCGSVRDEGEQAPPVLHTGTAFRCTACDGDTVVALMTPEEYEGENAPGSILAPVRELRGYVVELRKMLGDALENCAGWKRDAKPTPPEELHDYHIIYTITTGVQETVMPFASLADAEQWAEAQGATRYEIAEW